MTPPDPNEPPPWFLLPRTVRRVIVGLFVACAFFFLLDVVFFMVGFDKHPYLKWEQWPGFYAVFGFVACVILVLVSRYLLRPLVMRDEDYYEKPSPKTGDKTDV
jgi:hypothetical protein